MQEMSSAALAVVEVLPECQSHTRIIGFHDILYTLEAHSTPPRCTIILELREGGDLFDLVEEEPCDEMRATEILHGVLSALEHIHEYGLVHTVVHTDMPQAD